MPCYYITVTQHFNCYNQFMAFISYIKLYIYRDYLLFLITHIMYNKEKQEVVLLMQLPLYLSLTAGVTLLPISPEKLSVLGTSFFHVTVNVTVAVKFL